MGLLGECRGFLLRGNVIDLAVAVVIAVAFAAVVTSLVEDLLTPLIGAIFGEPDFSALTFTINDSVFTYGNFINVLLSFVFIAAAIFFVVVKPVNVMIARSRRQPPPDPTTKQCPECLSVVPLDARRCAFCTAQFSTVP
jgi:large conductance mechanosensitive channel